MRLLLALLCASLLQATPTNIVDVLLQPSGNPQTAVTGMDITISQTAFVSGNNYYPGFTLTPHPVSDSAGNVNLWLEPNVTGQLYQVLFRATNGVITRECWNVPTSGTPLRIKDVRSTVCNTTPGLTAAWGQLTGVNAGLASGAYSAYMPNPTYPPAYVINAGSSGDLDLYTVPVNRKAWLLARVSTSFDGVDFVPIDSYLQTKIAGVYYRLTNTTTNAGYLGIDETAGLLQKVLNAGETVSIHSNVVGLSTWLHLVEFDATSPLRSVTLTTFAAGDNTLYTVPVGKTFEVVPSVFTSVGDQMMRSRVYYTNASGGDRLLRVYAIPKGSSATVNNRIGGPQSSFVENGTIDYSSPLYGSLAPGDFIDVHVDSNAAGQMAWINIIEH